MPKSLNSFIYLKGSHFTVQDDVHFNYLTYKQKHEKYSWYPTLIKSCPLKRFNILFENADGLTCSCIAPHFLRKAYNSGSSASVNLDQVDFFFKYL